MSPFKRLSVLAASLWLAFHCSTAAAADRLSFIRDAEVESTIRAYVAPLLLQAGVTPESVRIHLVNDSGLNAFVAGGLNIFVHTGLMTRTENAGQLIGVLAHETGHIAGGHLARLQGAMENAAITSLGAMLLGAAAAAATGRGEFLAAGAMGGQEVALKDFFSFSRTQESSADQWAINALENTRQSTRGLLEFMEILGEQELLAASRQSPYARTHPLARDRVSAMRAHVERSKYSDVQPPADWAERHARMRAKLTGYLEPIGRVLQRYKESDNSLASRYARAIAYYRRPDLPKALALVDSLIAERPNDPYFHELRGQMLEENGRAAEGLPSYQQAVKLAPDEPLLRMGLAHLQIELGDPALLDQAIANLQPALAVEPDNSRGWLDMAIAQGRKGNDAQASLAQAEHALLLRRMPDVTYHVNRAEKLLPKGSAAWLRAQDLRERADRVREEERRR
jgi:predicted Zn-dependent protease